MIFKKKRHIRKLFFVIFAVLGPLLLWFNFVSIKSDKEDRFRVHIMQNINDEIDKFYRKHNEYPSDLSGINSRYANIIDEYIQSGVYVYSRDLSGKEWYKLVCRFSGSMKINKGKHGVSWTGLQYSNTIDQLDLMPGHQAQPDKNGFYPVDLH
jgi:hypothetical protein